MATLGVMNKNAGQDTRIYGIHDNLFRRRIDLKREEGDAQFEFPAGPGSGTRSALTWHPEPANLKYAGRRHFPELTRHKRLGYQDKTSMVSRDGTPQLEHRVSHRYDHLKKSSIFPFDEVKQKQSPLDPRNGIGEASPGDKPYREPEYCEGYYTRSVSSAPPFTEAACCGSRRVPAGHVTWQQRHVTQDIQDVKDAELWKPAQPLEPLVIEQIRS